MTVRATQVRPWVRRPPMNDTIRYHVRAWGSERHPDLNYETTELPRALHGRYPFVDICNIDRPAPYQIPKDPRDGQEARR